MKKKFFDLTFLFFTLILVNPVLGEIHQSSKIPWSGHWWPFTEGGLVTGSDYQGSPAPLEKYDFVTVGTYSGPATLHGERFYHDPNALSWEGFCYNWAAASILEDEPLHKSVFEDVPFGVGDKKGLLTAAYQGVLADEYPFYGPEDFHWILEHFIRDQQSPVMIDLAWNGEVWFFPVFKYETANRRNGNMLHFETTIHYASNDVRPDYVGTKVSKSVYNYFFTLDDDGIVLSSNWEGESQSLHPKRGAVPLGTFPQNPGLDLERVRTIAKTVDDQFRGNDSFDSSKNLPNGEFLLLGIEDDFFSFRLKNQDHVKIVLESDPNSPVTLTALNISGEEQGAIFGDGVVEFFGEDGDKEVFIRVRAEFPDEEPFYELMVDHSLGFQQIIPIHPGGFWRSGIAIQTNKFPGERLFISSFDDNGKPLKSLFFDNPNVSMSMVLAEEMDLNAKGGYVRIDSDGISDGVYSTIQGEYFLVGGNTIFADYAQSEVFFPHLANSDGWETKIGVLNMGSKTNHLTVEGYWSDGQLADSVNVVLEPGQKIEKSPEQFGLPADAVSACARTETRDHSLVGYTLFNNPSFASKGRTIYPANRPTGDHLFLPHIAIGPQWNTGLAIMNVSSEITETEITIFSSSGELVSSFTQELLPMQNFVQNIETMVPEDSIFSSASLQITTNKYDSIVGFGLFESADRLRLSVTSLQAPSYGPIRLPHIASDEVWWTGLGLMNCGEAATDILLSLKNAKGEVVNDKTIYLDKKANSAALFKEIFLDELPPEFSFIDVESKDVSQGLCGIFFMGEGVTKMMGGVFR